MTALVYPVHMYFELLMKRLWMCFILGIGGIMKNFTKIQLVLDNNEFMHKRSILIMKAWEYVCSVSSITKM